MKLWVKAKRLTHQGVWGNFLLTRGNFQGRCCRIHWTYRGRHVSGDKNVFSHHEGTSPIIPSIFIKLPHCPLLKKNKTCHLFYAKKGVLTWAILTSGRYGQNSINFHFCPFFIGILTLPTPWRSRRFELPSYTPPKLSMICSKFYQSASK